MSINSPNNSSEKQPSGLFAWIWVGIPFREEVLMDTKLSLFSSPIIVIIIFDE
jgi:hypothetical protein